MNWKQIRNLVKKYSPPKTDIRKIKEIVLFCSSLTVHFCRSTHCRAINPPPPKRTTLLADSDYIRRLDWGPVIFTVQLLHNPLISCLRCGPTSETPYLKPIRCQINSGSGGVGVGSFLSIWHTKISEHTVARHFGMKSWVKQNCSIIFVKKQWQSFWYFLKNFKSLYYMYTKNRGLTP